MKVKKVLIFLISLSILYISPNAYAGGAVIEDLNAYDLSDGVNVEISFSNSKYDISKLQFKLKEKEFQFKVTSTEALSIGNKFSINESDPDVVNVFIPKEIFSDISELCISYKNGDWFHVPTESYGIVQYCHPQCTDYVYSLTKICFKKCWGKLYGNANEWYKYAAKCKFDRSTKTPKDKSIICINASKYGHVGYVSDSKKQTSSKYKLTMKHANWGCNCCTKKIEATYNKDNQKIKIGNTWYKVYGFIYKWSKC